VRTGCDAVWLVALPTATIPTMGSAAGQGLDVRWIGQAPTWVSLLASGATGDYVSRHFWLAAQGPQWGDMSSPGMKQMLADVAKYKPDQKPDLYFAFGYAQALTVAKLLDQAVELGDLSHAGIKKALTELGTVDTLGLAGTYKYGPPDDRVPPEQTTIFAVDPSVPGALKALRVNYQSKTVKSYTFPKG
jgi:ABC-type branched-subunit amino acid transport system substrate-binding protein